MAEAATLQEYTELKHKLLSASTQDISGFTKAVESCFMLIKQRQEIAKVLLTRPVKKEMGENLEREFLHVNEQIKLALGL